MNGWTDGRINKWMRRKIEADRKTEKRTEWHVDG